MADTFQLGVSPTHVALHKGAFSFAPEDRRILPSGESFFIPSFDAGTPICLRGGDTCALGYVKSVSSSHYEEHLLLRDSSATGFNSFPNVAPRAASGGPSVTVDAYSTTYTSVTNFKSNVRSHLGLGSTESATYVRANIYRYEITDVGDLAASLSEVTTASKRVVRLVGVNSSSQQRIGWVYIETATTVVAGTAQRFIHQIIPADMLIGVGDGVTIEDYDNSSTNWDVQDLITSNASAGWQYSRCKTWYTAVASQTDLDNAGLPGTPDTPDGVTDWT